MLTSYDAPVQCKRDLGHKLLQEHHYHLMDNINTQKEQLTFDELVDKLIRKLETTKGCSELEAEIKRLEKQKECLVAQLGLLQ